MNNTQHKKPQNQGNKTGEANKQIIITSVSIIDKDQIIKKYIPKQIIAAFLIKDIIEITNQKISQRQLVRNHMNGYSMQFFNNYSNEIVDMQLNQQQMQKILFEGNEPQPLRSDNLIPIGTNVQQRNPTSLQRKQSSPQGLTASRIPRNPSLLSTTTNNKKNPMNESKKSSPKVYQYIKLNEQDLPKIQIDNDPFIEQLRKQKQSTNNKSNQVKLQKKSNLREIIKKDQKISFDFSGDIIKIKQSSQKSNFVGRSVNGNQNQLLIIKQKQAKIDTNPVNIDNGNKKDHSKRNLSKRGPDVEFSNINSLAPELQINQGVKFIHNKAILQKKKKEPSVNQLRKSISNRNLSKNDFQRLKSLGDSRPNRLKAESPSLPSIQKSQTQDQNLSIIARSASQAKVDLKYQKNTKRYSIFHTQKSLQKISIENQQLSEMMLQKNFKSLQDTFKLRLPSEQFQQTSKTQVLSIMDKANLQYIKTGSVGKFQLPKITYRMSQNNNKVLPGQSRTLLQSRNKLKGKRKENEFERLRKHFQDKLRI